MEKVRATPSEPIRAQNKKPKSPKKEKQELQRLKAEALRRQLFREHLQRELGFTQKSLKRGAAEWNEMLRGIKIQQLATELEDWRKRAWRAVDRKNFRIKSMLRYMEQTEELHQKASARNVSIMDFLIGMQSINVEKKQ